MLPETRFILELYNELIAISPMRTVSWVEKNKPVKKFIFTIEKLYEMVESREEIILKALGSTKFFIDCVILKYSMYRENTIG